MEASLDAVVYSATATKLKAIHTFQVQDSYNKSTFDNEVFELKFKGN